MDFEHLFKYMSIGDTSLDEKGEFIDNKLKCLCKGEIWFSHLNRLNDPYENQYDYDETPFNKLETYLKTIVQIPPYVQEKINELKWQKRDDSVIIAYLENSYNLKPLNKELADLKELIKKHKSSIAGILSLCSCKDNLLMWSHYAQNHEGICLSFSKKKPHKGNNILQDARFTKEVTYSNNHLTMLDIFPFYKSSPPNDKIDCEAMQETINKVFCRKSRDWEKEQEWRVILDISKCNEKNENGASQPFPGQLDCIYFGVKCPSKTIEAVKKAVNIGNYGYKTFFKKASLKQHAYGLDFTEID